MLPVMYSFVFTDQRGERWHLATCYCFIISAWMMSYTNLQYEWLLTGFAYCGPFLTVHFELDLNDLKNENTGITSPNMFSGFGVTNGREYDLFNICEI